MGWVPTRGLVCSWLAGGIHPNQAFLMPGYLCHLSGQQRISQQEDLARSFDSQVGQHLPSQQKKRRPIFGRIMPSRKTELGTAGRPDLIARRNGEGSPMVPGNNRAVPSVGDFVM